MKNYILLFSLLIAPVCALAADSSEGTLVDTPQADGFRCIWYQLRQHYEYGSKYSGGLGTYTANHVPMAHYVEAVNRTYGSPTRKATNSGICPTIWTKITQALAKPPVHEGRTEPAPPEICEICLFACRRVDLRVDLGGFARACIVFLSD